MLQALSPMVAVALARAAEARERAASAANDEDRDFWRTMERHWMNLAQSYELAARTENFLEERRRKRLN